LYSLAQKAEPATLADLLVAQDLLDTLAAHKDGYMGITANMIGYPMTTVAANDCGGVI